MAMSSAAPQVCDEARAVAWLQSLAGDGVREARQLRLSKLSSVTERHASLAESVHQIDKDLPRLDVGEPSRARVREVLTAWLALNNFVGYTQGMDMVCAVLLEVYERGPSATPCHDALASLAAVARINTNVVPLHAEDSLPMQRSQRLAERILMDVSAAAPRLADPLRAALPQIQMFVIRAMPPCFSNVLDRRDALVLVWDYLMLAPSSLRAARCRHAACAMLLLHRRLFEFGRDALQNFVIFEELVRLTTPAQASDVVELARHLERVETLCWV